MNLKTTLGLPLHSCAECTNRSIEIQKKKKQFSHLLIEYARIGTFNYSVSITWFAVERKKMYSIQIAFGIRWPKKGFRGPKAFWFLTKAIILQSSRSRSCPPFFTQRRVHSAHCTRPIAMKSVISMCESHRTFHMVSVVNDESTHNKA